MKICFLAPANSVHSLRWIKFFADRGHEIHWISLYPGDQEPLENAKCYFPKTESGKGLGLLLRILDVKRQVREINPNLLHIHSAAAYGLAGTLANCHPTVVTAWGSDVLITGKKFFMRPWVKRTLRNADLVTCDAIHMIDAIQSYGVARKKIQQINFGIDTERFKPGERSEEWRKEMGLGDAPTIISLRSLLPVYDIESLLRSAPLVLKEIPNAQFIIAGTGPLENELKSLANNLGIESNVNFIGRYDNTKLPYISMGSMSMSPQPCPMPVLPPAPPKPWPAVPPSSSPTQEKTISG